jgi:hypothetical protein
MVVRTSPKTREASAFMSSLLRAPYGIFRARLPFSPANLCNYTTNLIVSHWAGTAYAHALLSSVIFVGPGH